MTTWKTLVFAACAIASVPAAATITVGASSGSNVVDTDENVQFNDDFDYTDVNPLLTLTNKDTGVTFKGDENLKAPSSGQARVTGNDGNLQMLEFELTDPTLGFLTTEFNINVPNRTSGTASIFMYDQFGNVFSLLNSVIGNGNNWFYGSASDGQFIKRVLIQTSVNVDDVRQVRIGGVGETLPVIPEPATWAMMIAGFGLVGSAMRRRRGLASVNA